MTAFIGIDVGTGSARAGVFDKTGQLLGTAVQEIALFQDPGGIAEHSSADIWSAVCTATRAALSEAGVSADEIAGIGFDATCSLVVISPDGTGLPVGPSEDPARDVIVWMDHRAVAEAAEINAGGYDVLDYVGGTISPEMQTPKLKWLAKNRPETYEKAAHFFDLTDYLTWRATGSLARSSCTVTCKWTYLEKSGGWDAGYFDAIGLGDLAASGFTRIGTDIVAPGTTLGQGLNESAARDLGLAPGTAVGAGLIDAHAGGVGTVGAEGLGPVTSVMAYVFGTSSCTMTTTAAPVFVPGVWGPYFSAMVPGMWLNEGGQSAAGAAIAQLLTLHPAALEATRLAKAEGQSLPDWLGAQALAKADTASDTARLADGLHVVPEFLGNRAPHADPHTRAVIAGLGMDNSVDNLTALYIAGLCGLGYGLRQIVEAQTHNGAPVDTLVISGGAGRSGLVRQILADCARLPVVRSETTEPVLLGAAMLGAVASGSMPDLPAAMRSMSRIADRTEPVTGALSDKHDKRFALYGQFQNLAREAASI